MAAAIPPAPEPSLLLTYFGDKLTNPFNKEKNKRPYICYCCAHSYAPHDIFLNIHTGNLICAHCHEFDDPRVWSGCSWDDYTGYHRRLLREPDFTLDPYEARDYDSYGILEMKKCYHRDRMNKLTRRHASAVGEIDTDCPDFLMSHRTMVDVEAYEMNQYNDECPSTLFEGDEDSFVLESEDEQDENCSVNVIRSNGHVRTTHNLLQ